MSGITPNNTTKQIINNAIVKKLNNLETEVNTLEEGVVTVQDDISDVQNDIQDIQGNIETIQGNISDLNGSVTDINAALTGKQDTLTFDNEPRVGSNNPVKSGGIYNALETKLDKESVKFDPEPNGTDALSTGGAYDIVQDISERIDNIQNQGALLSNDNIDISNNGCLKIDNQQEVETNAIEVLNGDTKLKDTEIDGDLSVSGTINGKTISDTLSDSTSIIPTGKAVSDVISSLDASSVGGSGKYISEISETNGVITATSEDIDTAVTSGSSKPITSGGVYDILKDCPDVTYYDSAQSLNLNCDDIKDRVCLVTATMNNWAGLNYPFGGLMFIITAKNEIGNGFQKAISYGMNGTFPEYTRVCQNGVWQSWNKVLTSDYVTYIDFNGTTDSNGLIDLVTIGNYIPIIAKNFPYITNFFNGSSGGYNPYVRITNYDGTSYANQNVSMRLCVVPFSNG